MQHLKRLWVERLEDRTMLSASYGEAHFVPEQIEIRFVAWETGHLSEPRAEAAGRLFAQADAARQDAVGSFPLVGMPVQYLWGGWQYPRPTYVVVHFTANVGTGVNTGLDFESQSSQSPEDVPKRLNAQASYPQGETPPTKPINDWRPPTAGWGMGGLISSPGVGVATPIANLLTSGQETSTATSFASTASFRAHDTAFQSFSSQQLLLAAGADFADDEDANGDGDPRRASIDEQLDEIDAIANSRLRDDVGVSLETLKREREAVDQVLAELDQLGPFTDEHRTNAAQSREPAQPGEAEREIVVDNERPPAAAHHAQPAVSGSDAGMVLLAASGDANSSAYDLTATILLGAENSTAVPVGTEAAVGVYQAFDVSAVQPRTADAKETPRGNPVAYGEKIAGRREGGA